MSKPKEGYIKVQLDYAPTTNGKKFKEWCERYGFVPLGSGRRAWCGSLSTYFRGASGVANYDGDIMGWVINTGDRVIALDPQVTNEIVGNIHQNGELLMVCGSNPD